MLTSIRKDEKDMSPRKTKGVLLKGIEGFPIQVPDRILKHQSQLGTSATLVWINLLAFAQRRRPFQIEEIATFMGVDKTEVERALVILADYGWINDEGLEIRLMIPDIAVQQEAAAEEPTFLDEEQASFEWLISYWSARIGPPSPQEMRKLLFWMERKGMSHEVIAVAVEEMSAAVQNPSFPYLEGILRNWYAEGVRTYNDLIEKPYLSKVLPRPKEQTYDNPAEQKWKEVFPDEFD